MYEPKKCTWTCQPVCHLDELKGTTAYGHKIEPFECCDNKIAMQKMHCTCQPTTMGFMSKEEYLKAKGDDVDSVAERFIRELEYDKKIALRSASLARRENRILRNEIENLKRRL